MILIDKMRIFKYSFWYRMVYHT